MYVCSAYGSETEGKINWRKTKFGLVCSFQKIRALALSVCEKFGNPFYLKIVGIVW